MKYIVILGDGMADRPIDMLNNKTPLEVAVKPTIDYCAQHGECGMAQTIPQGMKPGSDVANLSVMGYDPTLYYSGRSPLEALNMGVSMLDTDVALRCNLVTLSDENIYENKKMIDYSAGEISTDEATQLMAAINEKLGDLRFEFYPGVSYRHCLIEHNGSIYDDLTPPHDISEKDIYTYLPKSTDILDLMKKSYEILSVHPINLARIERGLRPANSIWLWGAGSKPTLPSFQSLHGLKGAVISAVDLLKGIAIAGKMDVITVDGATGRIDTDFEAKTQACYDALMNGADYVYLHIEAPDECGHQGEIRNKVKAIELIDAKVVKPLMEKLDGTDYSLLICPDHATPIELRTHTSEPVPFIIYRSNAPQNGVECYTEKNCAATENVLPSGMALAEAFLSPSQPTKENPLGNGIVAEEIAETNGDFILPEVEKIDLPSNDEDEETTSVEGDIVAEIVAEDEKKKKVKKDKKVKNSPPLSGDQKKKRLIAIIITAVLLVIIAVVSIVTPIVILNKDKIFVKDQEDFGNVDKGNYYVLERDVTVTGDLNIANPYSIDLQGHTLKVNGTLSFTHNQNEKVINVGTKKGKEYIKSGIIEADKFEIVCAGTFQSTAIISTKEMRVAAGVKSTFDNGVQAGSALNIVGGSVAFNSTLVFDENSKLNINNSNVTIANGATTDVLLENATIELKEETSLLSITLDNKSNAKIRGKVSGDVTGGSTVIMTATSSANVVSGMEKLWINRDNTNVNTIFLNQSKISYIVALESPKDMSIEHTLDGKILVSVTKVNHAERYAFYVDKQDPIIINANESNSGIVVCDVTKFTNTAGSHTIKVIALGAEGIDTDLVTPSKPVMLEYVHKVKLDMPTNLLVTVTEDKKVILTFDKVNFADEYLIVINGKEINYREIEKLSIDITAYVAEVGSYSIRVQARSAKNPALVASDVALTSYECRRPHDKEIVLTSEDKDGKTTLTWNNVDTAKRYTIFLQKADGTVYEIKVHSNTFTFDNTMLANGDKLSVRADALGYYQDGAKSNEIVISAPTVATIK